MSTADRTCFLAVALVSLSLAASPQRQCTSGTPGNPAYIRISHDTSNTPLGLGPSFPSVYSFKAVTEIFQTPSVGGGRFYGGVRIFNDPGDSLIDSCKVDNPVLVQFEHSPLTTAEHTGASPDFLLKYVCCQRVSPAELDDVIALAGGDWQFVVPIDVGGTPCTQCPPGGNYSAVGNIVLDMSTTFSSDLTWEDPEEFGAYLVGASADPAGMGTQTAFDIPPEGTGPVWVIQDSCECRSLFEYNIPTTAPIAGLPTVQMATEFLKVLGDPLQSQCLVSYFGYLKSPPQAGQVISHYIGQNLPCAASEVLMESEEDLAPDGAVAQLNLLLGLIDRNSADGSSVHGAFYDGLEYGDLVEVQIWLKNRGDWIPTPPSGCPTGPLSYPYADPTDFKLWELLPADSSVSCTTGGNMKWVEVVPAMIDSDTYVYTVYFEGGTQGGGGVPDVDLLKKVRGLRITAIDDNLVENTPEILHLEVVNVSLALASQQEGAVTIGWSSAFRAVLVDPR